MLVKWWSLVPLLVAFGCGGSSDQVPPDTSTGDPPDPTSSPCGGQLGFPGFPLIPGSIYQLTSGSSVPDINGDGQPDLVYGDGTQVVIDVGHADGTFVPFTQLGTADRLVDFRFADLNGDGKLDLAATTESNSGGAVEVWMSTGTTFVHAPSVPLGIAGFPHVGVADMNGDTKPDLLVGFYTATDGRVAILLGDGTGGFALSQTLVGNNNAWGLEAVDLNGDGVLDVVERLREGFGVYVSGPGGYGAEQAHLRSDVAGVTFGDVTADGRIDVLVEGDGDLTLFKNQGDGSFVESLPLAVVGRASIAIADLDANGTQDVVVLESDPVPATTGRVSVILNLGPGGFGTATRYSIDARSALAYFAVPLSVAVADLDHDGHLDVLAGLGRSAWLQGTGTGTFSSAQPLDLLGSDPFFGASGSGLVVAVTDLDHDGRVDLVVDTGFGISVFLNTGTTSPFVSFRRQQIAGDSQSFMYGHGAHWTDLDGDGRLDLIGTHTTDTAQLGVVSTRLGTGAGEFATAPAAYQTGVSWADRFPDPHTHPLKLTALADINSDGLRDLVVVGSGAMPGTAVQTMLANADGTLSAAPVANGNGNPGTLVIGDFDGDGHRDVVVGDRYVDPPGMCAVGPCSGSSNIDGVAEVHYFRGLGDGSFEGMGTVWSGPYGPVAVAALDANSDGNLDLAIAPYVLLGRGDGTFEAPAMQALGAPMLLVAKDLNADGKADLVAVSATGTSTMLSHGDGTFGDPVDIAGVLGWPAFADFNGDGHLDLVSQSGSVSVALGHGDGSFDAPLTFLGNGYSGGGVSTGDADGDGRVDIMIDRWDGKVSILRGTCR